MRTKTTLHALIALAAASIGAHQASATPMLRLEAVGTGSTTIADGDASDFNSLAGVVTSINAVPGGNWAVNVTTGLSKPALGTADIPMLDLNSVSVSSVGGGTLNIWLTDTGFTGTANEVNALAAIGGTIASGGSVSFKTYRDTSNTAFGTETELTSLGAFTSSAFADSTGAILDSTTGPYSLTLLVSIFHDGSRFFQSTSFDASIAVPEPSSVFLLGAGLLATAFVLRRRRASVAA